MEPCQLRPRALEVTYLSNSGFALVLDGRFLCFDYCDPVPAWGRKGLCGGVIDEKALAGCGTRLFLFSHSHGDHYTKAAFALPQARFVVSDEFPRALLPSAIRLAPLQSAVVDGIAIRAYASTDLGVSFLVDVDGVRIFHAGDLNLWHWKHESTPAEIEEATALYQAAIKPLTAYADTIDLAFFPVDPRMGEGTEQGALDFAARLRPKQLIPMHLQGDIALAKRFAAECGQQTGVPVSVFETRGQKQVFAVDPRG